MERLWSPWRLGYVSGTASASRAASPDNPTACVLCSADDELLLVRGRLCYVILNLYPYNNGHLMVVPYRHVATLQATTPEERSELMRLTRYAEMALGEAYHPEGINVGVNLGRPAGAGIVDHLHIHLVPRWAGDTSFMSVVGNVRVLPEELGATATRLRPIFQRLAQDDDE